MVKLDSSSPVIKHEENKVLKSSRFSWACRALGDVFHLSCLQCFIATYLLGAQQ